MKKLFARMLDLILPRRERRIRTENRQFRHMPIEPTVHEAEGLPVRGTQAGARITTLMDYRKPIVEDLIRSLKYDGSAHAADLCADALSDFLKEEIAAIRQFSSRRILIVPVPLHRKRQRERGFNQIDIVLKRLPQEFRNGTLSVHVPHALARIRQTLQQTHLLRQERVKNVEGAFAVFSQDIIRDAHIFLIDDVATTGATLASAAAALKNAGAEVTLIALARA